MEQEENQHIAVTVYDCISGLIAIILAFVFILNRWSPVIEINDFLAGRDSISKWSMVAIGLLFYIPFGIGRVYVKKKYKY